MILNICYGWMVSKKNGISDLPSNVFLLSSNTWGIVPVPLSGTIQSGALAFKNLVCYTHDLGLGVFAYFTSIYYTLWGVRQGQLPNEKQLSFSLPWANGDNNNSETA